MKILTGIFLKTNYLNKKLLYTWVVKIFKFCILRIENGVIQLCKKINIFLKKKYKFTNSPILVFHFEIEITIRVRILMFSKKFISKLYFKIDKKILLFYMTIL